MISHRLSALAFAAAVTSLVWSPLSSLGADKPAVYTADQAAQGAKLFSASCAGCHGANLEGVAAPPLAGSAFMGNWKGKGADDLYYVISKQMPLDNPGGLKPGEYTAILAFVLQKNGYPAGTTPLDPAKLAQITITP